MGAMVTISHSGKDERAYLISLLLIVFIGSIVGTAGAADTCQMSIQDCPACSAGGLALTDSRFSDSNPSGIASNDPFAVLRCSYGNPLSGNDVKKDIFCYQDAGVAQKWYKYYRGEIPYPFPNSPYAPENAGSSYWKSPVGHRVGAQAQIFGKDAETAPTYKTAYSDWDFALAARYVAQITSTTPTDTISQEQASASNRERIQQFASCFASFAPGGVQSPEQQVLRGTIYATSYQAEIPQPLKYARITLLEEEKKVIGVETDAEGSYELKYAFQKGKAYRLEIGLAYTRGDKEYFTLYFGEPVESKKMIFRHDFSYNRDADLKQDVNLDDLWKKKFDTVNPFGIMYIHFTEAYEFYADYLKEDIHLNLPLKIVAFSTDPTIKKDRARYESDGIDSYIYISPRESIPESELRPASREYHEFSHYMMANTYGREPEPVVTDHGENVNHGGFLNPSTTDSWAEGFAHFMAGAIAERTQVAATAMGEPLNPCDGASYYGALEDNYRPWEYNGEVEEAAVAGTLWDIFDGADQKRACGARLVTFLESMQNHPNVLESKKQLIRQFIDVIHRLEQQYSYEDDRGYGYEDKASLTLPQLWAVMRTYHPDMLSFYEAIQKKYPQNKKQIDDIFLMHGFWKETSPGNGQYDKDEPYRDANGNKTYDAGEFYIDIAESLEYSTGEIIGTAADSNRTWRRTTLQLPGQFIRVNNVAPYYSYAVEFPGTKRWPYTKYAVNNDGSVFVPVPSDPKARITVKALGVQTGNPLVFTSQQFRQDYATAVKQGYYTSYDFQLNGPVPPQPKIPDVGGTGLGQEVSSGPAPDILSSLSWFQLVIAVTVVIVGIFLHAYLKRKKS